MNNKILIAIICVLAGAAKMKPRLFFALDVVGTIIVVTLLRLFSNAMGDFIKSFLRFNDRNYKWLMVVTVTSTLLVLARVGGKRVKAARSLADDASDGADGTSAPD